MLVKISMLCQQPTLLDSRELNQKWMREKEKKETEITQSITHVYKMYDEEREKNANKLVNMARENNGKKWYKTHSLAHPLTLSHTFTHSIAAACSHTPWITWMKKEKSRAAFAIPSRCMFSGILAACRRRGSISPFHSFIPSFFQYVCHSSLHSFWKLFWIRSNILFSFIHISCGHGRAFPIFTVCEISDCSTEKKKQTQTAKCIWPILPSHLDDTSVNIYTVCVCDTFTRCCTHKISIYFLLLCACERVREVVSYNWTANGTRCVSYMKHDEMSPHKWKPIISNCLRNVQTFFVECFVSLLARWIFPSPSPSNLTYRTIAYTHIIYINRIFRSQKNVNVLTVDCEWHTTSKTAPVRANKCAQTRNLSSRLALIENITWYCFR